MRAIEAAGGGLVSVFMDEKDVEVGNPIQETVLTAIRQCDELLVLLSQLRRTGHGFLLEIGVALGQKKLIAATIDKMETKDIPEFMKPYKVIDLNDFDTYVGQLVKRAGRGRSV